jgi:antitoxin ParD1/3/4
MPMSSLNISLPEQLKDYVESRVQEGDYGTPSEYLRELIRRDKELRRARLQRELLEALHSGDIELKPQELKKASLVTVLRGKTKSQKSQKE